MKLLISILLLLVSNTILAGPWIPVGNPWLRSDIEYLSDRGIINTPITTWPLMWSNVIRDVDKALEPERFRLLTDHEKEILLRIKSEFRKHISTKHSVGIGLSTQPVLLTNYSTMPRDEYSLTFKSQATSDHWSYNISLNYVHDPYTASGQMEETVYYDNSYIATVLGNVSIGYGWIDRWWGPGWNTSLILSNNARPTPGIFIQRNYSEEFESDWLKWIGPWTFQSFINILDDTRVINDAKLLGLSIAFKPTDTIEVGLRRTAQWGGDNRTESFDSLINLFLGRDNCGDDGILDCGANNFNEPGNQLAAIDVNWTLPTDTPMSFYAQLMGEDEAGYVPSRKTHLIGIRSNFIAGSKPINMFIEFSDTTTNLGDRYNITYEHYIYRSGYRYYGRPLGSSIDNDSEIFSIGGNLSLLDDYQLSFSFSNLKINVDADGFNSINSDMAKTNWLSTVLSKKTNYGEFRLFVDYYSDVIDQYGRQDDNSRIALEWETNY